MDYEAKVGLSRSEVRTIAFLIRKMLKIQGLEFPVLKVLDKLEILYPENIYFVVEEDSLFEENVRAYLEPESESLYCIHIRQSVYNGALKGRGDCLGFINHEIAHFCLIFIFGIVPKLFQYGISNIYPREIKERKITPYKSMEWQAKALCGELMIPFDRCKDMSLDQIILYTKSSKEQALYFLNKVVPCGN